MAERPLYSRLQLEQYYSRIKLPQDAQIFDVSALSGEAQLAYLTRLQRHQAAMVPFENLSLHYSWHRVINVNPVFLFKKIVQQPGRGGYCMENNHFFHTILLSLRFNVYMTGSRVFNPKRGRFGGFSHCLNVIIIDGIRYAVDVGYGGNGPIVPLKIISGEVQPHIQPSTVRFRYDGISQNLWSEDRLWIYEHRFDENAPWVPQYCFTGSEFLPEDIHVMNLGPSKSPSSWFTQTVVCVRFTTESDVLTKNGKESQYAREAIGEKINGALILEETTLKWRQNGVKTLEKELMNDGERLQVLETYFGIVLAEEDRMAIKGSVGELKPL